MENILNVGGIVGCIWGITYFLIRFLYFGIKNSFKNEIKKIHAYKYFLLIKSSDVDKDQHKMRILINALLKCFYIFVLIMICLAIVYGILVNA
jgi:hypothetical protein